VREHISQLVVFVGEIGAVLAIIIPIWVAVRKLKDGMKCQLRSDMLTIYYHNRESKKIRQYEYENFVMLYEAYKALKGNSFIDKIYSEVKEWEVVT
jgi:hypothetical protein